jgi:tetratricopeptide (TPR) repeat protein
MIYGRKRMKRNILLAVSFVILAITASYSNFFFTRLHPDDSAPVRDNPAIRRLSILPRLFTDSSTASTLPDDYVYRPVATLALAVDYFLGKGAPFFFRIDTFLVYLAGLGLIAWLYFIIFERTIPHPWNPYLAIMTVALFGLHPAVAELLNQLSRRPELYATLGAVGGVAVYAGLPHHRRFFYYLIPPLLGILSNFTGLVFGPLLLAYIILIEPAPVAENEPLTAEQTKSRDETQAPVEATATSSHRGQKRIRIRRRKHPFRAYLKAQLKRFMPALVFTGAGLLFESVANPGLLSPFQNSRESLVTYWFTQPWVAWRYFRCFFAPSYLAPASDLTVFTSYDNHAVFGLAFLLAVISVVLLLAISPQWRPLVFGLWWFMIGILPGALFLQPDVEDDIRTFLPFIGLAMSVTWAGRIMLPSGVPLRRLQAIAAAGILLLLAYQTHSRNQLWGNEEALWRDSVAKHPASIRALQNYAVELTSRGRHSEAMEYLWKARRINPQAPEVETHMGTVAAAMNHLDEADDHFHMGISMDASRSIGHFLYAVWLEQQHRTDDALEAYSWAASLAPTDLRPRYGMMRMYNAKHNWGDLQKTIETALEIAPGDPDIAPFEQIVRNHPDALKNAEELVKGSPTPENYLVLSSAYCAEGEFNKCLEAAQHAVQLRPDYALAYNNIGAAYISLGRLDDAIAAVKKALQYDPDDRTALNNWSAWERQKLLAGESIMRK